MPDEELIESYAKFLHSHFGNPSSVHYEGQIAKAALVDARLKISRLLGVDSHEIIFTSSATEALNLILRGIFGLRPQGPSQGPSQVHATRHVISSNLEHAAVYRTLKDLSWQDHPSYGLDVTYLPGGSFGAILPAQVEEAIRPSTALISLMAVNNETGVCTDIEAIAALAKSRNIPFVVDGVALFGKAPCTMYEGISAMAFSGHKFHAPKGTGFACIRKGLKLHPYMTGGEQEYGRRGGTENVAAALVLAEAALKASKLQIAASERMSLLRDHFERQLLALHPMAKVNGKGPRICNTSNICFPGVDGEALLLFLDLHGLAASMGSACASGTLEPSRVLLQMGLSQHDALSSLRFSLSRDTTLSEIDQAVEIIRKGIASQKF